MPIDAADFEAGRERYSIENEIVHFLTENRDSAFNVREVTVEVMAAGWSETAKGATTAHRNRSELAR